MQFVPLGQNRVQFGLPFSVEFDRGVARVYGSSGYFSPGVWYAGAGAGTQIGSRVGLAVSFSRSWTRSILDDPESRGAAASRHFNRCFARSHAERGCIRVGADEPSAPRRNSAPERR